MENQDIGQVDFLLELSDRQISTRQFFSNALLDSLDRNFNLQNVLISCYDTQNHFLSWTDRSGVRTSGGEHPYNKFAPNDVIGHKAYQDAVQDHLTYFNIEPRLYHSTDIIDSIDYDSSAYVRFIEENFGAHYSVTMALGINAYIQIHFFKRLEEGDFTDDEIARLNKIYVYVANSYKNFKKHEQAKIISNIQDEIISTGESAYLVTDDFLHIMSYNQTAMYYLTDILGAATVKQIRADKPCAWLPFLLGVEEEGASQERVKINVFQNYIFKTYTYDQNYSHGIVDRYHWITISKQETEKAPVHAETSLPLSYAELTHAEARVAELLCAGLTYRAIADKLVISYHTVKNHVQNIYAKCGINSRFQLYKLPNNEDQQ